MPALHNHKHNYTHLCLALIVSVASFVHESSPDYIFPSFMKIVPTFFPHGALLPVFVHAHYVSTLAICSTKCLVPFSSALQHTSSLTAKVVLWTMYMHLKTTPTKTSPVLFEALDHLFRCGSLYESQACIRHNHISLAWYAHNSNDDIETWSPACQSQNQGATVFRIEGRRRYTCGYLDTRH